MSQSRQPSLGDLSVLVVIAASNQPISVQEIVDEVNEIFSTGDIKAEVNAAGICRHVGVLAHCGFVETGIRKLPRSPAVAVYNATSQGRGEALHFLKDRDNQRQ